MAKQCWSQTVLESGSWGHSVLQTPALVPIATYLVSFYYFIQIPVFNANSVDPD